jgi:hypothetical protein
MKVLGFNGIAPPGYVASEPVPSGGILGAAFDPERIKERQLEQYVNENIGRLYEPEWDRLH